VVRARGLRLAAASAALLVVWTALAFTPQVGRLDLWLTRWMQGHAARPLDVALSLLSLLGNVEVDAVLGLVVGLVRVRSGDGRTASALWSLLVLGTVAELAAKQVLPHPAVPRALRRGGLNPTHHVFSTRYGFPSGHAFRTLFLVGALWPVLGRRPLLRGLLVGGVVAVDIALVYLGDHWASEVIAGNLLAGICLGLLEVFGRPRSA
jgi:membrane-associated phospholipid phosphatase